jgi:uncharacterized membrane protein
MTTLGMITLSGSLAGTTLVNTPLLTNQATTRWPNMTATVTRQMRLG